MTDDERRILLEEKAEQIEREIKHGNPSNDLRNRLIGWRGALSWVRDNLDLGETK